MTQQRTSAPASDRRRTSLRSGRYLDVIRSSSTRSLELQNGWSALLVGLLLLLPFDTFATAVGYRTFAAWAPEPIWGLSFLGLGTAQLAAVLVDIVVLRRIAAALLAVLFGLYVVGVAIANPISAGVAMIAPLVVGQVWAFYQARRVV